MNKTIKILLVEDNPGDVVLTKAAFKKADFDYELYIATDGEKALDFLAKSGDYTEAVTPDIILLDLNLPRMDGFELLQQAKSMLNIKRIPVIILTSSEAEVDVVKTYDLYANSYIVKPVNLEKFASIVQSLGDFWFNSCKLPGYIQN